VIVGFGAACGAEKLIYDGGARSMAGNINPYLVDGPNVYVESRPAALCGAPPMVYGNKPADGGSLIIEAGDYGEFMAKEPRAARFVRRLVGAEEFINGKERWCLWLVDAKPADLRRMPLVMERVEKCRQMRLASPKAATRDSAKAPALFQEIRQPDTDYVLVPCISSELREYIPIGFLGADTIVTDAVHTVPSATLYHFGVLTSSVHMAWTRAVCGRLEMRYRYSKNIVYNNFPWPDATERQKTKIEDLAQAVLDARALFPESSLADIYDPLAMPKEMSKAHAALDREVMKAYGYAKDMAEAGVVADLMERYARMAGDG
jgi:hypothetical protein